MKDGHYRRDILDLDELHKFLYDRRDRFGRISVRHIQLAKDLECDHETVRTALRKLEDRNVLRFNKKGRCSVIEYYVVLTSDEPSGVPERSSRTVLWQ